MVKRYEDETIKKKMNAEKRTIENLLDKILFLAYSDEEKIKVLDFIKVCRIRYLKLQKEYLDKRSDNENKN